MTTATATVRAELAAAHIALVERFRAILDPYDLAARLEADWRGEPPARRARALMDLYPRFVSLACAYPAGDVDALVAVGARLFSVRRKTLRADLATAMERVKP